MYDTRDAAQTWQRKYSEGVRGFSATVVGASKPLWTEEGADRSQPHATGQTSNTPRRRRRGGCPSRAAAIRAISPGSGRSLTGGSRRVEQALACGRDASEICAYTDQDWAGCLRTLKSTGGVALCIGGMINDWPSTNPEIDRDVIG